MKNVILLAVIALMLMGLTTGFLMPPETKPLALAVKIIRDVSRKASEIDWTNAKKGDILYSGDQIKTGERSIAIVKFTDGSMLRVRESSELKLFGTQKDGVLDKTVSVTRGEFTFDIQKQAANEKFTFSSPTSVAAIRGTAGTMEHNEDGSDMLIVVEGLVSFLNALSNRTLEVAAGNTAISNPDGSITVRASTPEETDGANDAINAARGTGTEKRLDLELKDPQGNKKKLRIRYND